MSVFSSVNRTVLPHKLRNAVRALHHASERNERQRFVAEGVRVCQDLLASELIPETIVVAENASDAVLQLAHDLMERGGALYDATPTDMAIMADATTPQDILAVVPYKQECPLGTRVVILDGVSDPGNVGTIIRSAAWFGYTDVVLGRGSADAYNTKVVRSAAGALFRMNVLRSRTLVEMLHHELADFTLAAAVASDGVDPKQLHQIDPLCLVIGSEAHGVSSEVLTACTLRITIPGGNGTESLNAGVAASILCYEASSKP